MGRPPAVEVDAPETVQVEVREQKSLGRILVHLVNTTGDMQRPVSSIIPLRDIKVRVRGNRPLRAFRLSDRSILTAREAHDHYEFTVDNLAVYDVVVLEF
jgi:hypothetical protein